MYADSAISFQVGIISDSQICLFPAIMTCPQDDDLFGYPTLSPNGYSPCFVVYGCLSHPSSQVFVTSTAPSLDIEVDERGRQGRV